MRESPIPALIVAATLLSGCGGPGGGVGSASVGASSVPTATVSPAAAPASRLLDPADFAAVIAEPKRVLIDVHIPFEGKLAGTDLMVPYNQIAAQAGQLPADRATPLAIYCRSGNMSAIAAPELAQLGFRDIVELRGGMDAWKASGRTLLTSATG